MVVAFATLAAVMLLVGGSLAAIGGATFGLPGVIAGGVATLVCWVSGAVAMAGLFVVPDPHQSVGAVLGGMLFRMGLPILFGLWLYQSHSPLLDAGIAGMLVISYLIGLFTETALAWWVLSSASASSDMAKVS